jgi:VanZ family protein
MSLPRLPRRPRFWFASFALWFAVLWLCSSFSVGGGAPPAIHHIDKLQHFGYFFGGGGLLTAALFRLNPERPAWKKIIPSVVLILAAVGWLDEWHQTFTPGRSGNDVFDWLADLLGASFAAFTFKMLHPRLKWFS